MPNAGPSVFHKYSSLGGGQTVLSTILLSQGLLLGAANATLYTKSLKGISLNPVTVVPFVIFREAPAVRKTVGLVVLVFGVILFSA